jgi:hypothetical protein
MMFKNYVVALYLGQKQTEASAVLGDHGSKGVVLHFCVNSAPKHSHTQWVKVLMKKIVPLKWSQLNHK